MEDAFSKFVQRFSPADTQPSPEEAEQPGAFDTFLSKMGGSSGPMETLTFYDGRVELRYDKVNHLYFRVDPNTGMLIPVEGVTTVCHIIDRSIALVPWAAKKVIEKLLTLVPTETVADGTLQVKGMTFEEFTKLALDAKTAPKDELEDAGDVGHQAHKWLEDYANAILSKDTETQKKLLTEMCADERATNCVMNALTCIKAHNIRWLATERKVYSLEHDYAGTLDGRCLVDSCSDPLCCPEAFKDRISIIDYKSSNFLYLEYIFQGLAYAKAEREELGLDIKDVFIFRLGKEDGKFEVWHLTADKDFEDGFAGFLACLNLYRLVHRVEERMHIKKVTLRAAKKEAKATAKAIKIAEEKAAKAIAKAEKKLAREQEKVAIKAAAETARAAKKKAREEEKVALKATTQDKKKKKVVNESKVLLERTAELSPKVAALLEDAHTVATPLTSIKDALDTAMQSIETQVVSEGNWEHRGLDIIYPGPLTTPVLKGTDEELQMQCMQPVPLPGTTEEESFPMFKLPEEKL